jgi:hypothetical protein
MWTPEWATSRSLPCVQLSPGSGKTFALMHAKAMIDNATVAATGMGKTEIFGALTQVRPRFSLLHELAHYRLEASAPQQNDDHLVQYWLNLAKR